MKCILSFLLLFACFNILSSCSSVQIDNTSYYNPLSLNYMVENPISAKFVVCGELFARNDDFEYQANLTCSKLQKKHKFEGYKFLTSCYILNPVAKEYSCVAIDEE
jgi:hypothetical protein